MALASLLSLMMAASATIHTGSPGVAVRHAPLQGVPLCVWNDSALFTTLKPGMQERGDKVFRFPNGSFSDIYHWNGTGAFNADSVWAADNTKYTAGWVSTSIHRGVSTSTDVSLIDDGDTATFWWSNADHPSAPGWFVIDLTAAKAVDSIALWLGAIRPDSVQILAWTGGNGIYPPPYAQADGTPWSSLARLPAANFVGWKQATAKSVRYLAVRPLGATPKGFQVREFKALKGVVAVTVNSKKAGTQNPVFAISTMPASRSKAYIPNWDFEAYMKWIHSYPGAEPILCVNYGTGTPEEAAAWVHYANQVKKYAVKRWQVGNEMSGQWEESGCVSARQYAERFVKFAQAMRAEDPTIEIEGPVLAGTDFATLASGDYDQRTWLEGYLFYVDSVEKATGTRLVDGIDFHNYPYWFSATPTAAAMMASCDGNGAQYDSLIAIMGRTIANPTSRQILMTEFNTSTVSSSLEMEASGGTATGLQFAHFIQRFGDRGLTNTWELYTQAGSGPDNTYGSLSLFQKPTQGGWSSLAYAPSASFWATRTIVRQWLDSDGGDTIMAIDQVPGARLFAVRNRGRVAILALNLGADTTQLSLDASLFPNGGDVLSWGTGEFLWNGTNAEARALPGNGPSSTPLASSWTGAAKIPPYGMLVVRGAGRVKQAPRTAHWFASATKITVADTLVISGWTTSEAVKLASGTFSVGGATGTLVATDGAWDGPSESWIAKIPGAEIGTGSAVAKITITDNLGEVTTDSLAIAVTGTIRPVALIADFENKKLAATWGALWYPWSVDGSVVSAKIAAHDGAGWCMRDSIDLTQPDSLNYTSFNTSVSGATNVHQLDSTFALVGVMFDLRTKHSGAGTFAMSVNLASVKNYDHYSVALPNTKGAWIRDTVLFANLKQAGWNVLVPWDTDSITGLSFSGSVAGTVEISLDNIYYLGSKGAAIDVGVRRAATHSTLNLSGRKLSIGATGPWILRLVSADGRSARRWVGSGAASISLPAHNGVRWVILEAEGLQRTLAVPPLVPGM